MSSLANRSKLKSFFSPSKNIRSVFYILVVIILFLSPNIVHVSPNLYGTYITYLAWILSIVLLTPFIMHRGLGSIGVRNSIFYSLLLVAIFTLLGFFLGFLYRRSSLASLLIDLVLLLASVGAAEVFRGFVMMLIGNRSLKILLGVVAGILFGSTILSAGYRLLPFLGYQDLASFGRNILSYIPQIVYNILISVIHVMGGFLPALAFRYIVDGYWRLSPYIPNTGVLGVLWPVMISLAYLALLASMPGYERIRGLARRAFRRGVIRDVISIIGDVFVVAMIVLISYSIYAGIVPLVVISGSMRPSIDIGDIALVARVRGSQDLGVGDAIAFWNENQIVIHRIVAIAGNGYITKGDANPYEDPSIVSRDLVIGKVVGTIPKIGWVTIIMRSGFESLGNIAQILGIAGSIKSPALVIAILIALVIFIIGLISIKNKGTGSWMVMRRSRGYPW